MSYTHNIQQEAINKHLGMDDIEVELTFDNDIDDPLYGIDEDGRLMIAYLSLDDCGGVDFEWEDDCQGIFREFGTAWDRDDYIKEQESEGVVYFIVNRYKHGGVHYSVEGSVSYPDERWDVAPCAVYTPPEDLQEMYKGYLKLEKAVGRFADKVIEKLLSDEFSQKDLDRYAKRSASSIGKGYITDADRSVIDVNIVSLKDTLLHNREKFIEDGGVNRDDYKTWYGMLLNSTTNKISGAHNSIINRNELVEYCNATLDSYSDWCNGSVFGVCFDFYENAGTQEDPDWSLVEDEACWGFIGHKNALSELNDRFNGMNQFKPDENKKESRHERDRDLGL